MRINESNYKLGNQALASVLLLYYHLLTEDSFTNDQTVYVDPEVFNGFDFLGVQVSQEYPSGIDEKLLPQGAVIYLLCDLNDLIAEYESYLEQPLVQKILNAHAVGQLSAIPESGEMMNLVRMGLQNLDYQVIPDDTCTHFQRTYSG
jgi:hypothetical protein